MAQILIERSPRILVVDDDTLLLGTLEEMLRDRGYAVETAVDGDAALQKLKAEPFDIIVTDLHMPGMSGLELIERISCEQIRVAPVLMSSLFSGELKAHACQAGAYAQLDKPFSSHRLFSVIERGLHDMHTTINTH